MKNQQNEPMKQYAMKVGKKFLTLNPATWTWHLSDRVEDLNIWDYHHDLECMLLPGLGKKIKVQYIELTAQEIKKLNSVGCTGSGRIPKELTIGKLAVSNTTKTVVEAVY